jgi:hypothetical protein
MNYPRKIEVKVMKERGSRKTFLESQECLARTGLLDPFLRELSLLGEFHQRPSQPRKFGYELAVKIAKPQKTTQMFQARGERPIQDSG